MAERDLFADDVLERLCRSDSQYQREHGHYIVPLALRLLASRARELRLAQGLRVVRDTGTEVDRHVAERALVEAGVPDPEDDDGC